VITVEESGASRLYSCVVVRKIQTSRDTSTCPSHQTKHRLTMARDKQLNGRAPNKSFIDWLDATLNYTHEPRVDGDRVRRRAMDDTPYYVCM
jgi:hypothetical protein